MPLIFIDQRGGKCTGIRPLLPAAIGLEKAAKTLEFPQVGGDAGVCRYRRYEAYDGSSAGVGSATSAGDSTYSPGNGSGGPPVIRSISMRCSSSKSIWSACSRLNLKSSMTNNCLRPFAT